MKIAISCHPTQGGSGVVATELAVALGERGHEVHVVADAVSSRTPENLALGLDRMKDAGAKLTSVEMALFEMLGVAEGDKFKEIIKIVK